VTEPDGLSASSTPWVVGLVEPMETDLAAGQLTQVVPEILKQTAPAPITDLKVIQAPHAVRDGALKGSAAGYTVISNVDISFLEVACTNNSHNQIWLLNGGMFKHVLWREPSDNFGDCRQRPGWAARRCTVPAGGCYGRGRG